MFGEKSRSVWSAVVENMSHTTEMPNQFINLYNSMDVDAQSIRRIKKKIKPPITPERLKERSCPTVGWGKRKSHWISKNSISQLTSGSYVEKQLIGFDICPQNSSRCSYWPTRSMVPLIPLQLLGLALYLVLFVHSAFYLFIFLCHQLQLCSHYRSVSVLGGFWGI